MENYSVLMSVYYKETPQNLYESMQSIYEQTVATNDFILVCDGNLNDELNKVIDDMQNKFLDRLHVCRLDKNVGLGNALNIGIQYCKNELIARMDSDDIAMNSRCEIEIAKFKNDNALDIVSSTIIEFQNTIENVVGKRKVPLRSDEIIKFSKKRNPFNHPSVMFRKSAVLRAGGYSEKYHLFEDYYLWIKMMQLGYKGENILEPLLYMRCSSDMYQRRGGWEYARNMLNFRRWLLEIGWISNREFALCAFPHLVVCIVPNYFRRWFYKYLHS